MTKAIAYIDSTRMVRGLTAGIWHLFQRREYIDRINVFPVPDGDTGTNMAFSFKVIHEAVCNAHGLSMKELMTRVADASLDGSRGNSGAIMAQYFHGFSEALGNKVFMNAAEMAKAISAGAKADWTAMSEQVAGTLPTVLEDFSIALERKSQQGIDDIRELFEYGLQSARKSLARTPDLRPVLKQAVVVDAGGQGFVDLLEGTAYGTLNEKSIEIDERTAVTVMMVSGGYPEAYENGKVISGTENINDSIVFHAGTKKIGNNIVTAGGRVIAVSSYGTSIKDALATSYKNAEVIQFDKKNYRKDLGFDL